MTDFSLFDNINTQLETKPEIECIHQSTIMEKSTLICQDCGLEIEKDIFLDKNLYPEIQNKQDISRCQIRKNENKNIYKDVEDMGFGERIVSIANETYLQVTDGNIFRGNSRKAIVFACIYYAYKAEDIHQDSDDLIKMFNIKRRVGIKGLKTVESKVPKDSLIRQKQTTPTHLVTGILKKFNATQEQINEVVNLYEQIKDKSSIINRARPQSTSAGLVYYFILKTNKNITLDYFISKVDLSKLTIKKIVQELDRLFETNYMNNKLL